MTNKGIYYLEIDVHPDFLEEIEYIYITIHFKLMFTEQDILSPNKSEKVVLVNNQVYH